MGARGSSLGCRIILLPKSAIRNLFSPLLHIAECYCLSKRRQRVALRHELMRQVAFESSLDDGLAHSRPVHLLGVIEFVATRHAAGVEMSDVLDIVSNGAD